MDACRRLLKTWSWLRRPSVIHDRVTLLEYGHDTDLASVAPSQQAITRSIFHHIHLSSHHQSIAQPIHHIDS